MSENLSSKWIIQSITENQKFIVDRKVIDSSELLKNICDITEITEPILLDCSSHSLNTFITLINHYDEEIEGDEHDTEFEKTLYDFVTSNNKQKLIKLIQDLCILDCDFFLNSIADYILGIIGDEEKMDVTDIRIYLGVEDDFNEAERKLIEKTKKLEYFLSIDTENLKFPFQNKSVYSLETDFSTPLNILISRIIQRSNATTSYLLSLINKTIKNEIDRNPFKLSQFSPNFGHWQISICFKKLRRGINLYVSTKDYDKRYFNILKERKVIVKNVSTLYSIDGADRVENDSLNFVISKKAEISFRESYASMYHFNLKECQISSIFYTLLSVSDSGIKFEEFYNHLIATDLSKTIELQMCNDIFKFFYPRVRLRFFKKPNASKFQILQIRHHESIFPSFKSFVTNYMEDDGVIKSSEMILGIPLDEIGITKVKAYYYYPVLDVKKYLDFIVTI